MSPIPGSIHRRPRSDSGAARLWTWARAKRGAWTCPEAAEDCGISPRRCRAIVTALADGGLLDCVRESETVGGVGQASAEWRLSAQGRALAGPPVMIVDGDTGLITGVRAATNGDGTDKLRQAIERSGLSTREAARRLHVNDSTLRRMLRAEPPVADDDPIIARARELRARGQ